MKLFNTRKKEVKHLKEIKDRTEECECIEIVANEPIGNRYRRFLSDPATRTMDFQKYCVSGLTERSECQRGPLLAHLRQQYMFDEPDGYIAGRAGPDVQAFERMPLGCQTCILRRHAPGCAENLIALPDDTPQSRFMFVHDFINRIHRKKEAKDLMSDVSPMPASESQAPSPAPCSQVRKVEAFDQGTGPVDTPVPVVEVVVRKIEQQDPLASSASVVTSPQSPPVEALLSMESPPSVEPSKEMSTKSSKRPKKVVSKIKRSEEDECLRKTTSKAKSTRTKAGRKKTADKKQPKKTVGTE